MFYPLCSKYDENLISDYFHPHEKHDFFNTIAETASNIISWLGL